MFDDTSGVDVDSSEDGTGRFDDESSTTEELATNVEEEAAFRTDTVVVDKGVLELLAFDEDKEVVGCATVFDDAICAVVDCSEISAERIDDASSATDDITTNDGKAASGIDVDKVDKEARKVSNVDENTVIVGCAALLDNTIGVNIEGSEAGAGRLGDAF